MDTKNKNNEANDQSLDYDACFKMLMKLIRIDRMLKSATIVEAPKKGRIKL